MKTKLFVLTLLTIVFTNFCYAQTYADLPWEKGIVIKKGKEIEGMIKLDGGEDAPWLNQETVYFVKLEDYVEGKKVRRKYIEEYEVKDLDGYSTDRVTYVTQEIKVLNIFFKKKPKKFFLEKVVDGPVSVYRWYNKPEKKIVATSNERENDRQSALEEYRHYLQKEGEELVQANECDLVAYFESCPAVAAKLEAEEYGFKLHKEKKKGLGGMIDKGFSDAILERNIQVVVEEYNQCKG